MNFESLLGKSKEELIDYIKNQKTFRADEIVAQIFDNLSLLAVSINQSGKITYINEEFCKSTGYDKDFLLTKNWDELFEQTNSKDHIYKFIKKKGLFDKIKRKILSNEGIYKTFKFDAVIHQTIDDLEEITTLIGEDISNKKKIDNALKESNLLLKDLFDNANDLIQVFDLSGNTLFVNNAWKRTLGYDEEEINKIKFDDIIHEDYKESTKEHLNNILKGEHDETFESAFVSKLGKKIYVICSVNIRYENNTPRTCARNVHKIYFTKFLHLLLTVGSWKSFWPTYTTSFAA
jgi:PAS domain S-box-containing protein